MSTKKRETAVRRPAAALPTTTFPSLVYRILDANLNRATEGLRVVEEYLRFGLEDVHLSTLCKQVRHDLVTEVAQVRENRLHAARDVTGDVGTTISTQEEYQRVDVADVAVANVKRVEQSLRSMEEYTKVEFPQMAAKFESLRYRVYTLERAISMLRSSQERLVAARLYVLIDGRDSLDSFRRLVTMLLDGGVDMVQLRDKQLSDRELFQRATTLRELTRNSKVLFIMNDRVDLALAARADGVHLGQDELPVREARRLMNSQSLIGVSTHRIEQARQAVLDGANYIGCGPTFPSATKSFQQFPGVEYLRQVQGEIALPAFPIGGIDQDNIADVCETGMFRAALSRGVLAAPDPAHAARQLAGVLHAAHGS